MRITFTLSLLLFAWPWPPRAAAPPPPCISWLGIEAGGLRRLACGAEALAAAQALGVAAPRAGEHLSAEGRAWLPARLRLRLGLKLDVNQASTEDLQAISGIGPSTAARIIAARPFSRLAELRRAHGVGPKRLARWRASLQLGPPPLISLSAGRRSE